MAILLIKNAADEISAKEVKTNLEMHGLCPEHAAIIADNWKTWASELMKFFLNEHPEKSVTRMSWNFGGESSTLSHH